MNCAFPKFGMNDYFTKNGRNQIITKLLRVSWGRRTHLENVGKISEIEDIVELDCCR